MSGRTVFQPFIAILDSSREDARLVVRALRPRLPKAKMRWFSRGRDAWRAIVQSPRIDPYLLITDWIGTQPKKTSLVRNIRNRYPRVPIILHSASAADQDVVKLQNREMLIDIYVAKSEGIERLLQVAVDFYQRYAKDPVLSTVRSYLARCTDPHAPFTVIGNKEYSLVEMYQQMSQQTAVGEEALDAWRLLLEDAIDESRSTEED